VLAVPPEKGSFPLDHNSECKSSMQAFLGCMKEEKGKHHRCKELSKKYLECRIERGLMQEEDLDELGFKHEVSIDEAKFEELRKNKKERKGYIGGLSAKGWTDEELGAKSESE